MQLEQDQQKRIRFTLYLAPEEIEALEKRQAEIGVSKAEQIRRALRAQYLGREVRCQQ